MALKELIWRTNHCVMLLNNTYLKGAVTSALAGVLLRRFYTTQLLDNDEKASKENGRLIDNLELMGVDITRMRKRDSRVLTKETTHEMGLRDFLETKGADREMVASIISRFPRAIVRDYEHLDEMWSIWKSILSSDMAVLTTVQRSPESFFRSSNLENLKGNVHFLQSLGLPPDVIRRLMASAPRTFSNSVELNRQKVNCLQDLCVNLGGENPLEFVREIIKRSIYILTRSTRRITTNVQTLQSLMKLEDRELLLWIQGSGSDLLLICSMYLVNNFESMQEKLQRLGVSHSEIIQCIYRFPSILLIPSQAFAHKIDLLLKCGMEPSEILSTPHLLKVSLPSLKSKINELARRGYDFKTFGCKVLVISQPRFASKLSKLSKSE